MYGTPAIRAYTLPFLLFMLLLAVSDFLISEESTVFLLANPRFLVYPLQTIACGAVLIYYWKKYPFAWPTRGLHWVVSIAIALLVLGIWISPQELFGAAPRLEGFDPTLVQESALAYWSTIILRFMRLVIVVPLLEEIFWRGFLMRYLMNENFESVEPQNCGPFSIVAVAFAFGLAHMGPDFWPAVATGLLYNWLYVYTRSIGACVIAHAITNLILGLYIMKTGQWGFW